LEVPVSSLEHFENNNNVIQIDDMALQLRNKLVHCIKPELSCRAARDEHVSSLQTEEKYQQLTTFIKMHDSDLSVSDLSRHIKVLQQARVSRAHDEQPLTELDIDSILRQYTSEADEYSSQAARVVVHFLKIFSMHHNEPLIVSLT
jgi:hypothetical protein